MEMTLEKRDVLEYKLKILMRALEVHGGYIENMCERYLESKKENISVTGLMPPVRRLMNVFHEVYEMRDLNRSGDEK